MSRNNIIPLRLSFVYNSFSSLQQWLMNPRVLGAISTNQVPNASVVWNGCGEENFVSFFCSNGYWWFFCSIDTSPFVIISSLLSGSNHWTLTTGRLTACQNVSPKMVGNEALLTSASVSCSVILNVNLRPLAVIKRQTVFLTGQRKLVEKSDEFLLFQRKWCGTGTSQCLGWGVLPFIWYEVIRKYDFNG